MTTVTMTTEDVARGEAGDCETCPVALAMLRAFPYAEKASAGPTGSGIRVDGLWRWQITPLEPANFMDAFDSRLDNDRLDKDAPVPGPVSFEIDLECDYFHRLADVYDAVALS